MWIILSPVIFLRWDFTSLKMFRCCFTKTCFHTLFTPKMFTRAQKHVNHAIHPKNTSQYPLEHYTFIDFHRRHSPHFALALSFCLRLLGDFRHKCFELFKPIHRRTAVSSMSSSTFTHQQHTDIKPPAHPRTAQPLYSIMRLSRRGLIYMRMCILVCLWVNVMWRCWSVSCGCGGECVCGFCVDCARRTRAEMKGNIAALEVDTSSITSVAKCGLSVRVLCACLYVWRGAPAAWLSAYVLGVCVCGRKIKLFRFVRSMCVA